mgnify:CR=1 FL=1
MNARTTQLLKTLLRDVPRGRWLLVLSTLLAACASGASVALMGVSAWLLSRAAEMPSGCDSSASPAVSSATPNVW